MDGKRAYSTFNGVMLGFLILIALSLAAVIFFTKSSVFSKVDEHGCNNSAGYTFSYAKNKCIKVYEEALQFNKTGSNNPNDLNAFIVFSDDNKSADMFLPDRIYAFLQVKDNNTQWHDNSSSYILYNLPEKLSLTKDNQEIYYIKR
ncbi:MAG: hypothetical protein K2N11_09475 [Mucispirillum sp.]|nr:hypothetical protein [Mucispirillum sp.]